MMTRYKHWASDGFQAYVAREADRIAADDLTLIRRILDHVHVVEDIFRHHLDGRAHNHRAVASADLPSFAVLHERAGEMRDWYVAYADALAPGAQDEAIDFAFTSGTPGRMTRGEILLYVATHGIYHHGNADALLHRNGIAPSPVSMTDFLNSAPR
jgi:uncharacterized damage-inducible protein DinB